MQNRRLSRSNSDCQNIMLGIARFIADLLLVVLAIALFGFLEWLINSIFKN